MLISCNGKSLIYPQDITRIILGAIIQTIWGISPPFIHWSSLHNRIITDYLWAICNTPFGLFSNNLNISFSHYDAGFNLYQFLYKK